jgi:hypothetical protein
VGALLLCVPPFGRSLLAGVGPSSRHRPVGFVIAPLTKVPEDSKPAVGLATCGGFAPVLEFGSLLPEISGSPPRLT